MAMVNVRDTTLGSKIRGKIDLVNAPFLRLSTTIVPVLEVGALVGTPRISKTQTTISGAGFKEMYACAQGKKIKILGLELNQESGAYQFKELHLKEPNGNSLTIKTQTSAGKLVFYPNEAGIVLEGGWKIEAFIDIFTAGGTANCWLYHIQEEAF